MATTTKTTKKTAARKPAAKKTAARKPAAKPAAAKVTAPAMPTAADVTERIEDAFEDVVKFVRDATHTYMGMGTVVQRRLINRDATDKLTVESFLQEAKAKGADPRDRDPRPHRADRQEGRRPHRADHPARRGQPPRPGEGSPRDGPRARSHPARRLIPALTTNNRPSVGSGHTARPGARRRSDGTFRSGCSHCGHARGRMMK